MTTQTTNFRWEDPFFLDSQLTEDERIIKNAVSTYASNKLAPRVLDSFRNESNNFEIFKELGELGLFSAVKPISNSNKDSAVVSYGLIAREIERIDSGYRSMFSVQSSLVILPINEFGTVKQKEKYLPKLESGE